MEIYFIQITDLIYLCFNVLLPQQGLSREPYPACLQTLPADVQYIVIVSKLCFQTFFQLLLLEIQCSTSVNVEYEDFKEKI